jgi:hypothetical protein
MSGKTIPLELDPQNLLWLRARAHAAGNRSLSDVINEIVTHARGSVSGRGEIRSVVGKAQITSDDPDLAGADAAIRALFEESRNRFTAG